MNQPDQPYQGPTQFPGGQTPPPSGGPYGPPPSSPPGGGWGSPPGGGYPTPGSYSTPPDYGRPAPGGGSGNGSKAWLLAGIGLLVGVGLGIGGGYLLFSGDPTDSDEYSALESDLDTANDRIEELEAGGATDPETEPADPESEPADPESEPADPESEPVDPEPAPGDAAVEGWTISEPEISADSVDDFFAEFDAVNDQDEIASFDARLELLSGGTGGETVADLSCYSPAVEPGEVASVRCVSIDDFVADSWDTVVFTG